MLYVNKNEDFRQQLAEAVVKQNHPGWQGGSYFANPDEGKVYYRESTAPNPWQEGEVILPVEDLLDPDNDYSGGDQVDWKGTCTFDGYEISLQEILEAWAQATGETETDGFEVEDEAIQWAMEQPQFQEALEKIEEDCHELAVNFVLSSVLDVVEVG